MFFRYSRAENEVRFRRFLEDHYEYYCQRAFSLPLSEVTRHEIQRVAKRGWGMIGLPMILLGSEFNSTLTFSLANGLLFFGGLMMAYSWYGSRCMRVLNLETVQKHND